MYDVAVLTESRYLAANEADWYTRQVHAEDGLVMQALERQGLRVTRRDWADPAHGWQDTRSVLFRTTWDYFHRFGEFSPWLDQVSRNARLFNEAALIRWNLDKHYLGDLARAGVNVVPTAYVERGDPRSLAHVVAETGWDELILKPAISGAARHTYRFSADEAAVHECTFGELVEQEAMMLQPFQHQVLEQGETSLMVLDGRVTHAIRKTPKSGDFRVQDDWGGTVHPHEPAPKKPPLPRLLSGPCRLTCCMPGSTPSATTAAGSRSWNSK